MNYPIHIDTISMELSILYFKGLMVKIFIKWCTEDFLSTQTVQTQMNCHLMWHFICVLLFAKITVYWYEEWKGFSMKSVDPDQKSAEQDPHLFKSQLTWAYNVFKSWL